MDTQTNKQHNPNWGGKRANAGAKKKVDGVKRVYFLATEKTIKILNTQKNKSVFINRCIEDCNIL